jgi:3-phytase/alkaline phosphatase D
MKFSVRQALAVILLAVIIPSSASRADQTTLPDPVFTVASGDISATSVVLWAHSPAGKGVTFTLTAENEPSPTAQKALTESHSANQPYKAEFDQLKPGTRYRYTAQDAEGKSLVGTFRTPNLSGKKHGLRFGVTGDWRQELAPYPAIKNIAARNLDFFVAEGDTIYADYVSPGVPKKQAKTLEEYRAKHAENLLPRYGLNTWADARASTAFFATIDDHEVANDFAGGAPSDSDGRFEVAGKYLNDTPMYKNGLQAFTEFYPIRDTRYTESDPLYSGKPKLYRTQQFGDDAAIFILDTRSYRSKPIPSVPNNKLTDADAIAEFWKNAYAPDRTLMGTPQKAQLKADLLAAQKAGVTWKFILNPEPIQNLGVLIGEDRWDGYSTERTELLQFITENKVTNVVFITADFHGTMVNDLYFKANPTAESVRAFGAWEIITGAVAFDAPFGPTVVQVAAAANLLTANQQAAYNFAPLTQKDQVIKALVDTQVKFFGFDPLGLDDNPMIDFTLKSGAWAATHTYGWTEFEIDAQTQELTVSTYGITWYSAKQLATPGEAEKIAARQPAIVQQFTVKAR